MRRVKDWWRLDGKILTYKLLLLLLFLSPILKNVPAIKSWLPDDSYALLFLAACMFLLLQIVMALLGEKTDDVRLITLNSGSPEFVRSIGRAKKLDIAFSSTETLFAFIHDALLTSEMECRVLLRNPQAGNERMRNKLLDFEERWKGVAAMNPKCKIQVKYCNNTVFRMLLLDRAEAYVGFYKVDGTRLLGHSVPMLHVEPGTVLGEYLLAVARNRFDASWAAGTDTIGERASLV